VLISNQAAVPSAPVATALMDAFIMPPFYHAQD
jgi:hypothetical protein